jgi:cell shape-determining protein MreD
VVSFGTGFGQRTVFRSEILMPILVIPGATLVYELVILGLLFVTGWSVSWGAQMTNVVLPCVLVNTICMPAVYLFVRVLYRRTYREEIVI